MTIIPSNTELQNNNIDTWERLVLYSALMLRSSYLRDEGNQSNRAIAISLFTDKFPYSIKIQSSLDYSSLIFNDSGIGLVNPIQNISSEDARFRFDTYTPIVSRNNLSSDFLPFYNYPDFVDTLEKLFIYSLGGIKRFLEEEGDTKQENFSINFFDLRTPEPQIITEAQLPFDFNCWVNDLHFFNCLLPVVPLNASQTVFDYSEINLIFNYTNFDEQLEDYQIDIYNTSYELALNLSEVISDYSKLNLNFPYIVSDGIDESISQLQITEETVSEVGITESLTNEVKLSFTSNDYLIDSGQQLTISYETSENITEQVDIESETTYQNIPDIDIIDAVQSINYSLSISITESAIDTSQELSLTLFSQINDEILGQSDDIQLNINYQASINESVIDLEEFSINSNYDSTVEINDIEQTIEYNLTNFVLDSLLDNSQLNYSQEYYAQESILETDTDNEYIIYNGLSERIGEGIINVEVSQENTYIEEIIDTYSYEINVNTDNILSEDIGDLTKEVEFAYSLETSESLNEIEQELNLTLSFDSTDSYQSDNEDNVSVNYNIQIETIENIIEGQENYEIEIESQYIITPINRDFNYSLQVRKEYDMVEELTESMPKDHSSTQSEVNDFETPNYESTVLSYNPKVFINFETVLQTFDSNAGLTKTTRVYNELVSPPNDFEVVITPESQGCYAVTNTNYSDINNIGNIGNENTPNLTLTSPGYLVVRNNIVNYEVDDVVGQFNWTIEYWKQWNIDSSTLSIGDKIGITNNRTDELNPNYSRNHLELTSKSPDNYKIFFDNLSYSGLMNLTPYHVVITSGSQGLRLFVNGVLRDSNSSSVSFPTNGNDVFFYISGRRFVTFITNHIVSIAYWNLYDYELSSTQVQTLYDRGKL